MEHLYLYGAGGHAKVVRDNICSNGDKIAGVFDVDINKIRFYDIDIKREHEYKGESPIIISIGDNKKRKIISEKLCTKYGVAIHNTAILSPSVEIGEGTVVMASATIQADSKIGKHCIINTKASVDHGCVIRDYAHISPGATLCGNVYVGEGSWIGAGAVIIPGVKVGKWCVVGAGSVVTKDIPDGYLAVGNRCSLIKKINQDLL